MEYYSAIKTNEIMLYAETRMYLETVKPSEISQKEKRKHIICLVLEKTLESPLDCKEIQPVHSKGDQSWVFFGRNDAKAEAPVLWPPHAKC